MSGRTNQERQCNPSNTLLKSRSVYPRRGQEIGHAEMFLVRQLGALLEAIDFGDSDMTTKERLPGDVTEAMRV